TRPSKDVAFLRNHRSQIFCTQHCFCHTGRIPMVRHGGRLSSLVIPTRLVLLPDQPSSRILVGTGSNTRNNSPPRSFKRTNTNSEGTLRTFPSLAVPYRTPLF